MRINYYQTDDRDSYFASMGKNRTTRRKKQHYTITDSDGKIVFELVSNIKAIGFVRDLYNTTRRKIRDNWKELLIQKGYSIKTELI
jgi:hypothetical protein